ncbi:hypothetical protein OAP63_05510 [Vibrio sp.]|nr:hypothetical protein [Vibrio viridaestus]MDC0610170.1 hypothetical protein [Vibrio sp.]
MKKKAPKKSNTPPISSEEDKSKNLNETRRKIEDILLQREQEKLFNL